MNPLSKFSKTYSRRALSWYLNFLWYKPRKEIFLIVSLIVFSNADVESFALDNKKTVFRFWYAFGITGFSKTHLNILAAITLLQNLLRFEIKYWDLTDYPCYIWRQSKNRASKKSWSPSPKWDYDFGIRIVSRLVAIQH